MKYSEGGSSFGGARIVPFGEAALLVEFSEGSELERNAAVHALARGIDSIHSPDVISLVPGYVSLLIEFEPDSDSVLSTVSTALVDLRVHRGTEVGRLRRIPVVYGGQQYGPDLDKVAADLNLTPDEVIAAHTRHELTVYLLGFAPGLPYLGDLAAEFSRITRLDTPRTRVPRGSVGVVGRQSVIYPRATPGGWRIIGRTPVPLWDERRTPPAYLRPGDRVRFEPIAPADWQRFSDAPTDW
jgi:inhibitor of KinA